jgi:transposase
MERAVFGIDVSQATLDIAREGHSEVINIANSTAEIRKWLKSIPSHSMIAVESTGKLHRAVVHAALAAGHTLYVLSPRDLHYYARSLGRRAKTDRLDALLIARYLQREHANLHPYQLPSELQAQLQELLALRHGLVLKNEALRQSFSSVACELRATKKLLHGFKMAIQEIDQRLEKLIAQDPHLASAANNLRTVPGFGPLLSASLAHAITRHPFTSSDSFIAYIGLDPRARDSGQLKGRRYLSKRGPALMRRLLFVAAMSACKTTVWRPTYQHYRVRGFSTTATLVILARKLARLAFSIVRNGTVFQPDRLLTTCAQP